MKRFIIKREEGSVLVVALIMLALLSILGFAITMTTRLDIQIAGNEYISKQNLYSAEGAAVELIQEIENGDEKMVSMSGDTPEWLIDNTTGQNNKSPALPATPFKEVDDPEFVERITDLPDWDTANLSRASALVNNTQALAFFIKVVGSRDLSDPRKVYEFRVFGRSNLYKGTRNDGWAMVEMGYRKVF